MAWHQFSITTTQTRQEAVEDALLGAGAVSITLRDAKDQPILEPKPNETPTWDDCIVDGLFLIDNDELLIRAVLDNALNDTERASVIYQRIADKDWVRAWLDDFKPMPFGQRLWVVPSHIDSTHPIPSDAIRLTLDPGLAFGTGTHATTRLCLRWLDEHIRTGQTVMDFGCGSGILAIASVLLGADKALVTDIDPQAIQATHSNARINQVNERIHVLATSEPVTEAVDVWVANILAAPLIELAPAFAQQCPAGCLIALSGILKEQVAEIETHYTQWFELAPTILDDGWALVSGKRHAMD